MPIGVNNTNLDRQLARGAAETHNQPEPDYGPNNGPNQLWKDVSVANRPTHQWYCNGHECPSDGSINQRSKDTFPKSYEDKIICSIGHSILFGTTIVYMVLYTNISPLQSKIPSISPNNELQTHSHIHLFTHLVINAIFMRTNNGC